MSSEKRLYVARVIPYQGSEIVNICDEELLGMAIIGNGVEIRISKEYFGGDPVDSRKALALVQNSSMASLAGRRIVEEVLRAKLASEKAVKRVGAVPFLMIFKFAR